MPAILAALLTLAASLGALYAYRVSLWSEQQRALHLTTEAAVAIANEDAEPLSDEFVEVLGVDTWTATYPIAPHEACGEAVKAVLDVAFDHSLPGDLSEPVDILCASRRPIVRRISSSSPGFFVAAPTVDETNRISGVRLLITTGHPAPSFVDLAHRPSSLAVALALAAAAAVIAYQWSDATRRRLDRLLREASVDGLTRSLRREPFLAELGAAILDQASRPLTVLVVDVDRLKPTNDNFGHRIGDEVLRTVAELIRNELRSGDVVGRLGGDEFAALTRRADAEQAAAVAERIRARIEAECAEVAGAPVAVTVSIGIAEWRSGDDAKSLLERGDLNLYTAKRSNRNRVVIVD